MADLENKNAKGLKDVRKTLEEKRKQKAALELELAMLEAEPNRKILWFLRKQSSCDVSMIWI